MKKLILALFIFTALFSNAQVSIGQWQVHLPYHQGISVSKNKNIIYCVTEDGFFSLNELDNSITELSKINGLSDVDISTINSSEALDITIIAYENSNIDIIKKNEIVNISDIKNKQIIGNKHINSILFVKNYAYLATGFGIVKLNLEKEEIADTYYVGEDGEQISVNELAYDGTYLYAATENGIYKAQEDKPEIINYQNWTKFNFTTTETNFLNICLYNNDLYVLSSANSNQNNLYKFTKIAEKDTFLILAENINSKKRIKNTDNNLVLFVDTAMYFYNNESAKFIAYKNSYIYPNPKDLILNDNSVIIADYARGLILKKDNYLSYFFPDGPYRTKIEEMDVADETFYATLGGRISVMDGYGYYGELYKCKNKAWIDIMDLESKDWTEIKINPRDSKQVFIGTTNYGLIEIYDDKIVKRYDINNFAEHTLQSIIEGNNIRIGGLAFDEDNNLWITNFGVEKPISVLKKDGTWRSFNYKDAINYKYITDIIITQDGTKWCILPRGEGLFAFNNNQTIDNEDDDLLYKFQNKDKDGAILSNTIYAIAEDRDGVIWLGTSEGIVVYYNPSNVFDNRSYFYASQIIIEVNGEPKHLLKTELVQTIEVDGANQKWIGTEKSGVFVVSPDGTKEIAHFTAENSPLLSNNISKIKIDKKTGTVYIATSKGLISYKGKATEPDTYFNDVYVYPNPVRENYSGDVVIKGLIENTNVKITDIAGNFVYETTSLGGQALWNGKTLNGERVKTGVYLVFLSNEDGTKTFVTKLLFIN